MVRVHSFKLLLQNISRYGKGMRRRRLAILASRFEREFTPISSDVICMTKQTGLNIRRSSNFLWLRIRRGAKECCFFLQMPVETLSRFASQVYGLWKRLEARGSSTCSLINCVLPEVVPERRYSHQPWYVIHTTISDLTILDENVPDRHPLQSPTSAGFIRTM